MAKLISVETYSKPLLKSLRIEISYDEALALHDILMRVGGNNRTRRVLVEPTLSILRDQFGDIDTAGDIAKGRNAIYFEETDR